MSVVTILEAVSEEEIRWARQLFRELFAEYATSPDLSACSLAAEEQELAELPGEYVRPGGCIFIAQWETELAGCVALRRISKDVCEMKRLYVRPAYRGREIGRALALAIIGAAHALGYTRMCLDTLPSMKAAIALYRSLGFRECAVYRENPIDGALFMERILL